MPKLKVFISWSGERSHQVAKALHDWLPQVLNNVRPFLSSEDVRRGGRWLQDIASELEVARIGIFCVTSENRDEPWLLFEAGALAKTADGQVCTYLLGLRPAEIEQPLAQFNATEATEADTYKLVQTINARLGEDGLSEAQCAAAFEMWWPRLSEKLDAIPDPTMPSDLAPVRSDRDMIEEILELLRNRPSADSPSQPNSPRPTPGYTHAQVGEVLQWVARQVKRGAAAAKTAIVSTQPVADPNERDMELARAVVTLMTLEAQLYSLSADPTRVKQLPPELPQRLADPILRDLLQRTAEQSFDAF